jgi:hypothetical protein
MPKSCGGGFVVVCGDPVEEATGLSGGARACCPLITDAHVGCPSDLAAHLLTDFV